MSDQSVAFLLRWSPGLIVGALCAVYGLYLEYKIRKLRELRQRLLREYHDAE